MPSLVHSEQKQNRDPIQPGHVQSWRNFKAPFSDQGAWVISAFPRLTIGEGPHGQSDSLTIEHVIIESGRDAESDPAHKLHFNVRNVGASTITHYVVNVWHLLP